MGLGAFEKLFDPYDRKARLFPGLLVVLPLGGVVLAIAGSIPPLLKVAISLMVSCGVPFLLTSIARDAGKKLEDRLFKKWGGMPSTQLLRHSDSYFDTHTKRDYHEMLAKGSKVPMPSSADELADPQGADDSYRAAGFWLRGQTKNAKDFPHVFRENVAYGFRRNATGLKLIGFLVALVCMLVMLAKPFSRAVNAENGFFEALSTGIGPLQLSSIVVSGIFTIVWATCFSEEALHRSARAYADRLIRSCVELKKPRKSRATLAATN